jgi:hypothetical protein
MKRSIMRGLLSSAAIVSVCAFATDLHAQSVTISGAQTATVKTSTASSGSAATSLTIANGGSITLSIGSSSNTEAILLDSPAAVDNEGTITVNNGYNTAGILAVGGIGGTSSITVGGSISVTDNPAATTLPLTPQTSIYRFGILVAGNSPLNGSIDQTAGTIAVRGNQSAGIFVGPGGLIGTNAAATLANGITQAAGAAIGITASNVDSNYKPTGFFSYGVRTIGYIQGSVSLSGTVSAVGAGAIAVSVENTVAGQVYIDGSETADGFYNGGVVAARPVPYPTNLNPNGANLLQSGPVVFIGSTTGTPAGGTTAVQSGVEIDTAGTLVSIGSSPALFISSVAGNTTTIDQTTSGGAGLQIDGTVKADGIYDGISATGIQIGGSVAVGPVSAATGVGTTTINGGIDLNGTVAVNAFAANATGISFQTGAQSGMSLTNTGTITALVKYGNNGTTGGNATAIADSAGALSTITNEGTIKATVPTGYVARAIDLTGSSSTVTLLQQLDSSNSTPPTPSIIGDIVFGSGPSTLDLKAGTITGNVSFLNSSGTSANLVDVEGGQLNGNIAFGGGSNTLTVGGATTGFVTGSISETGGTLGINVNNGLLTNTNLSTVNLSQLTIGSSGQLVLAYDPANDKIAGFDITGQMIVDSGAKLGLNFQTKLLTPESFTIINAQGGISAPGGLLLGDVPYFYVANFTLDNNSLSLAIRNRTFGEAGVPGNAAAYRAIFGAYDQDPGVFNTFNAASTQQAFRNVYNQALPNYTGGLFELLSKGADALTHAEAGNPIMLRGDRSGAWAQQLGFGVYRNNNDAPGYHGGGLGFAFGYEDPVSTISSIGYTVAYLRGSIDPALSGSGDRQVGSIYSAGVYWREVDGPFHANASLNIGYAAMNEDRNFNGTDVNGTAFTRAASSTWSGGMANAHIGVDYEQPLGDGFYVRPQLSGDFFMLYEDSHGEHNGGDAFNLNYASSFGKQGSGTAAVSFGMKLGDEFIWRPEITAGWRQVFGGPDDVTAQFTNGGAFTLTPPSQGGGALARIGVHGGDEYTDIAFEAGGEERGAYRAFDGQLVARFGF